MFRSAIYLIFIFIALVFVDSSYGSSTKDSRRAFDRQKQQLKARYKDFFNHHKKARKFQASREAGAKSYKAKRIAEAKKKNQARLKYKKKKHKVYDSEALHKKWLAKSKKINKKNNQTRKQYILQRNQLRSLSETSQLIPPAAEVGLMDPEDVK